MHGTGINDEHSEEAANFELSGTLENLEALLTKGNVILHVRGQLFATSDMEDSRLLRGDPCGRWLPRTAPAVN